MSNPPSSEPQDERSDEEKYVDYGRALRAAIDEAIAPWLLATLEQRREHIPDEVLAAVDRVRSTAFENLTTLVEADVERPLSGPLEQIRRAVSTLTAVLDEYGFERPKRDPFDEQMQPDDVHGLGPASFLELSEEVQIAGITWGAAKAHLHKSRRR